MNAELKEFKPFFLSLTGEDRFSRLGRVFKTKHNYYFYDVGTGKVFQIDKNLYLVIDSLIKTNKFEDLIDIELNEEDLIKAMTELKETVDKENILLAPPVKELTGPQVVKFDEDIRNLRGQITLELTERCNLRCKYCIYHEGQGGYRQFGKNDMTFDIAKRAIDQLVMNSKDDLYISFYGGEPLIRYDLIEQCLDYCKNNTKNKKVSYAMTTNATLVTPEIAERFAALDNVFITVSLDGPKEMHNKYRVYKNGEGSFDNTIRGLKLFVDAFGERAKDCVQINVVLPEYEQEKLDSIQQFFDSVTWLPKDTLFTSSFVSKGEHEVEYNGVDSEREKNIYEQSETIEGFFNPLMDWGMKEFMKSRNGSDTIKKIAQDGVIKDLALVHNRMLVDKPMNFYFMNGCCIPGARRVYVTSEGKYLICEKVGKSPSIGNVYTGLDIDSIKKIYVNEFIKEAMKYCKNCWAVHLCSLCYLNCYSEEGTHFTYRHGHCEVNRISVEKTLSYYHEIMEQDPEILSFLNEYKFS